MVVRALNHPILGPKFGPIPNAKKCCFFYPNSTKKKSQFFVIFHFGSPSLFHIIQVQNILLHINTFTE